MCSVFCYQRVIGFSVDMLYTDSLNEKKSALKKSALLVGFFSAYLCSGS